ncbi:hypothetical protein BDW67DRAFT_191748 [Aspergillus spinulosporus]
MKTIPSLGSVPFHAKWRHCCLPTRSTHDNTYILGRVHEHNVVIACLPSGVYGTTSAAISARRMQSTFHSIRFFLMVGIGGGAPSDEADIRLGDVVVSRPTREFGGVIQYDYGKTVSGGVFAHTGMLNKPLSVLLAAIVKLQATHKLTPSRIPAILSEMADKNPRMKESFAYDSKRQDLLFDSNYDHRDPESTCNNCDTGRLVTRPARTSCDPVIHYGLIASRDQVMKDARTRDKLSRELGILCFEMEAAGLMDDFQCLVIRGICDYSDSHKNKQWQEYAAAVAAAYTKELLSVIHPVQVMQSPIARSDIWYYRGKLPPRPECMADLVVRQDDVRDLGVPLAKISDYDHERVHQRLLHKRLVGTTEWFLGHPDFKAWFTEKTVTSLWCSGKIGSGKTMIATTVVEAAKHRYTKDDSCTVFFYCENECQPMLDDTYILASFIRQLCEFLCLTGRPYPGDVRTTIRRFFGPKRIPPNLTDIKQIFISLFNYVPETIYIIDGLDALDQKHSRSLMEFIQSLFRCRPPNGSRILLSSRDHVPGYMNIATFIPGIAQISTSTNVLQDIEVYIGTSISDKSLYRKLTDNTALLADVKQKLLAESSGIEAVAFHLEDTEWNPEKIPQKDVLIGCCANLVLVDPTDNCVRFAHSSNHNLKYPSAEEGDLECGELCVIYLSFSDFNRQLTKLSSGTTTTLVPYPALVAQQALFRHRHKLTNRIFTRLWSQKHEFPISFRTICTPSRPDRARYKFLSYAIAHWALHTKAINSSSLAWEKFKLIATCFNETWNFHPWLPGGCSKDSLLHGLFCWAVREQHEPLLSIALAARPSLHRICDLPSIGESLPALHTACKLGYRSTTEILLNFCKVNVLDGEGYTALHHAANEGHTEICELLLGVKEVNVDLAASKGHHERIVSLLLEKGPDIELKAGYHQRAPLWQAMHNGHDAMVKLLLDRGADLESKNDSRMTPLLWAARNGREVVVKLLRDKDTH